ncbi:hypothetical protein [Neobacillus terrae]|uniref:hypothetical protein n=1 Tax=Neobacillus terrae TaxID=3034837 RepID=UPI0014088259|nr:hypothetical protein [Neobacillus terrae]NHM32536.1 hypothetical protein [Neobacillus terrae]
MKLFVFFGLIGLSLFVVILFSLKGKKNSRKKGTIFVKMVILNLLVFGLGSFWWFVSETNGISQVVGVFIYLGSFLVVTIINLSILYLVKIK